MKINVGGGSTCSFFCIFVPKSKNGLDCPMIINTDLRNLLHRNYNIIKRKQQSYGTF